MPSAPPRVPGLSLVNGVRIFRDPLSYTMESARLGDVVDLHIPFLRYWLINHPDLIEEALVRDAKSYIKDAPTRALSGVLGDGLLTSEGDRWRRRRRMIQPAFHRERIQAYGETMVRYTERLLTAWAPNHVRELHDDMMRLTREIVAKTLFDADVAGDAREAGDALEALMSRFAETGGVPLLHRIPTPSKRRHDAAVRWLDAFIAGLVADRRRSGRDAGDLLSMLVAATDEEGRMTDRELRDEVMTLFLAGHETTANALTWTFVLLDRHPAARAALERELDEVLGDRPPTVDDLRQLRYTEHVVHETMRLYPPAWAIGREAIADTSLGGYAVPKGTSLWISQYIVHRDPRFFDDPEVFRPERWAGDLQQRLPRYAYFPFGGGPRICIGNTFAIMEAVLVLAAISKRWRVRLQPGRAVVPAPSVTLRPRGPVLARVERRG